VIEQTEGGTYEVLQDARRTLQEEGKLLAKVYNEPAIFELEAKKIFTKTWIFLAHESEIPWPGDYVLRRVISDSFIVTRDEDGQIHVLFNMCKHRGMQLCRSDAGNASHFRCPYHLLEHRKAARGPVRKGGVRSRGARQGRVFDDRRTEDGDLQGLDLCQLEPGRPTA
jgi:nitrite reductase/ring-hydroxylating ferredoxin subunit